MAGPQLSERFIDAIGRLERDGDVEAVVGLYAPDCRVGNVLEPDAFSGPDGARRFWQAYREQFASVTSEYRTVVDDGSSAALEWTTQADVNGRTVSYSGVTVVESDGAGVTRSCAYFDPHALGRQSVDA